MARIPSDVRVTSVDVPFLSLTWFFVKSSLALGLAFALTSWVWVLLGAGTFSLMAALMIGAGVPQWFAEAQQAPATVEPPPVPVLPPPAPPAPPPPAPAPAPAVEAAAEADPAPLEEPSPETSTAPPGNSHQEATDEAMRAELERARRERARR